jgi:hypothetical protein
MQNLIDSLEEDKYSIADDLNDIALLLNNQAICEDISSLYSAVESCKRDSTDDIWKYRLDPIVFKFPSKPGHVIPNGADNVEIMLFLCIEGTYMNNTENLNDPLSSLEFNIVIKGIDGNNIVEELDEFLNLESSWHLDKHEHQEGDGDGKLIHPEYHLTFGGHVMENSGLDFGSTIVLRSPRIEYPPMDAILGIDFILKNFFTVSYHKKLTELPEYQIIVKRSQKRLWKPYFLSLASFWDGGYINELISPNKLFPSLIKEDQ